MAEIPEMVHIQSAPNPRTTIVVAILNEQPLLDEDAADALADAIVATLSEAGLVCVPKVQTEAMQLAGIREHVGTARTENGEGRCLTPGLIYRAMISAALAEQGEP